MILYRNMPNGAEYHDDQGLKMLRSTPALSVVASALVPGIDSDGRVR